MAGKEHGYSGKPLFRKLGIKPDMRVLAVNAPDHYDSLMQGAEDSQFDFTESVGGGHRNYDVVHLFCDDSQRLAASVAAALLAVGERGMLWVSWPKKGSDLFCGITGRDVRKAGLDAGWVDVKVCAVDADWSGHKFLRRKS